MIASYYSLTDKGVAREHNEDSFLNNEKYSLFMVADGMGGHQFGDFASKITLSATLSFIENATNSENSLTEKIFKQALQFANKTIFNLKFVDSSIKVIGSTFVGFIPGVGEGYAFNVGDSRLYQFRDNVLNQITKDHTLEDTLPEFMHGIGGGKYSSILSKAIGSHASVEPDVLAFSLTQNDIILICSDGLYSMVSNDEIINILKLDVNLKSKTEQLINLANKNGGQDNITVTLINIESIENQEIFEITKSY